MGVDTALPPRTILASVFSIQDERSALTKRPPAKVSNCCAACCMRLPARLTYLPLLPLALRLLTGLYLFALPYLVRWRAPQCRARMSAAGKIIVRSRP